LLLRATNPARLELTDYKSQDTLVEYKWQSHSDASAHTNYLSKLLKISQPIQSIGPIILAFDVTLEPAISLKVSVEIRHSCCNEEAHYRAKTCRVKPIMKFISQIRSVRKKYIFINQLEIFYPLGKWHYL